MKSEAVHLEWGGEGGRGSRFGGLGLPQARQHALNDVGARLVACRQGLPVHVHGALRPRSLPHDARAALCCAAAQRAQQRRPRRIHPQPDALCNLQPATHPSGGCRRLPAVPGRDEQVASSSDTSKVTLRCGRRFTIAGAVAMNHRTQHDTCFTALMIDRKNEGFRTR